MTTFEYFVHLLTELREIVFRLNLAESRRFSSKRDVTIGRSGRPEVARAETGVRENQNTASGSEETGNDKISGA